MFTTLTPKLHRLENALEKLNITEAETETEILEKMGD